MMQYRDYLATVEYDDEAELFHGEVINVRDVITFQGRTVTELKRALKSSVEDYLDFCKKRGESPDKPFSGKFVLRISPQLHGQIAVAAKKSGKSLNTWAGEQLERAASA